MNDVCAGKRERAAVAEKRRGYRPRESESRYFERVGERERDENDGAEDTRQSFRNGGRGQTRSVNRDGAKGREGCAQEKEREREKKHRKERRTERSRETRANWR